ncbi:MAG TPA: choice-of-anchor D domain-containing protein [Candidatus Acidoferrales bacterium]|nr:choice-of-anchor D domain-containing protein [Candidatus Acidoferrales bacterium]
MTPQTQRQAVRKFAKLPWAFEPNAGQTDSRVKFLARADAATVYLTANGAVIAWRAQPAKGAHLAKAQESDLSFEFSDSNENARITGQQELPGKTNYLIGNDPRKWHTNIPHFSAVKYGEIYPGIDARFYGGPLGLEYDLTISPGSDLRRVALRTNGAARLRLGPGGNLLVGLAGRDILMRRPEIYQLDGHRRIPVSGGYRLLADNSFGFGVGEHRNDLPLIIDPSISVTYTTFLGGNGAEKGNSVAYDSVGKVVYVGGTTTLPTFPETAPTPTSLGPVSGTSVLFAAKIDTTQSGAASLSYLTFIGGSLDNEGGKVAVDNSTSPASLAIVGWTTSTDFPVTDGSTLKGSTDLTVSKLNGIGSGFVYSLYFGGSGSEATQGAAGVATDSTGDVFVTSNTSSTDLPQPTVPNGFQTAYGGGVSDGFLAEFAAATPSPGALLYSTYFGINGTVGSTSVALDASGNAYVAGFTSQPSNTFPPLGVNTFQSTYGGGTDDGIVLQVNPSLVGPTSLVYASFLGGTGTDQAFAISVDNASPANAYVTGATQSPDFVSKTSLTNGFQTTLGSGAASNAFLAVISQTSSTSIPPFVPSLTYASYLGGTGADSGQGIAVVLPSVPGPSTDVLVAGKTTSADFPVFCPSQSFTGTQDVFIASFNPTASGAASLAVSSLLGGSATAEANAVATDAPGDAIIFGDTTSSDYLANNNPNNGFQLTCTSCMLGTPEPDAFLTQAAVSTAASGCLAFAPPVANLGSFPVGSTNAPPVSGTVTNNGNGTATFTGFSVVGTNAADFPLEVGTTCTGSTVLAPAANCVFSIGFTPTVAGTETASLQITDTGANSPKQSLNITGIGTAPDVTLSPNTGLTFGSVTQGVTSPPQTVTLTNSGNANLTISSIAMDSTGNTSGFAITSTSNCLTGTIAPSASCTITVDFTPSTTGPLFGQVNINDDALNNSSAVQTVALSGTGNSQTFIVGFVPTSLAFPNQNVGTNSSPMNVTLTNSGTGTLNITGITFTGANPTQFVFDSTNTCPLAGGTVGANGGTCLLAVDFAPTAVGAANADISVADNASSSPQTVPLSGTGAGAVASLSATTLTFPSTSVGGTSPSQTVTLTNTGNSSLIVTTIGTAGTNPGDFQIVASGTPCPIGAPGLAPSASCVIAVDFAPTASGSRFASVSIADNAGGSPQSITLTGTGTQPVVMLSQTTLSFGSVNVNTTSTGPVITLTNTGNQALTITSVKIDPSVGTPGDFSFPAANNTCASMGSVPASSSCTITVSFTPASQGSITGRVDIADDATPSTQTIALSGTGTAPGVSLSPTSLNLGSQNVGTQSAGQSTTLTNTGSGPLTINTIGFTGPDPGDFNETNNCPIGGAGLASGNACTITVTFTPAATGARTASLSFSDTGPGSPQIVSVAGTGTIPAVAFSPGSLSFSPTVVGTSSNPKPMTVSNTGNGPLVISNIAVSGADAGDFSETDTCLGVSVASGKSCAVNVNFVPQAFGARTATITLTDNTVSGSHSFNVSGQATDFQLAATGGVTTATISAGQTAIFPLQVNPENGFTGTVTLGCTNPPPQGGCTVSPTSIQITGSTPVSFNVSVCTLVNCASGGFTIPVAPPAKNFRIPKPVWWLLSLCLLVLLRRSDGKRKRRRLVPTFAAIIGLVLLSSCGGGGTKAGGGTPPGKYIVTVTGAFASGAAHPLPLTVTVQ